jgi:antitoxin ChpS
MITTKVRRSGNSAAITLTAEALAILDVKEGDTVFLVRDDMGGLRILADTGLAHQLETTETVMDENRELLARLA